MSRPGLVVLLICTGCATAAPAPPDATAPEVAVEHFLALAAAGDHLAMGSYFGTTAGSVLERDPAPAVERRMYLLASVLKNDGYAVEPIGAVPGRVGRAHLVTAHLRRSGRELSVTFTTVRGINGGWLVEQVDVEAVTGAQPSTSSTSTPPVARG